MKHPFPSDHDTILLKDQSVYDEKSAESKRQKTGNRFFLR